MLNTFRTPKVALALSAALVYLPTLFFGWVYLDDYLIVQEAGFYAKLSNIPASFTRQVWLPSGDEYMYYRPVSTTFYVLAAWLSTVVHDAVEAWPFHLINICLISTVAVLAYTFLKNLKVPSALALVATLLLVVHPSSVSTVAWISGQNEMLLAVFVLAAFNALITERYLIYSVCLLAALLTKENALVVPILSALFMCMLPESRSQKSSWIKMAGAWMLAGAIWLLLLRQGLGQTAPSAADAFMPMLHGFAYQFIFLGKMLLPFELNTLPIPLDTPRVVFGAGLLAGVSILAWGLWQLRRRPLILFGFLWFMAFLLPTFARMNIQEAQTFILRGDRSFLASIGIVLIFTQYQNFGGRWRHVGIAGLLLLLALNIVHQFDYRDGLPFYAKAAEKSPRLAFAHTHLGDLYIREKDYPRAIERYQRAIALNDHEYNAYNNLGVAYNRIGEINKAMEAYQQELARFPRNILSWYNLGAIWLDRANLEEGEKAMRRVVEINPAHKAAWAALMLIYRRSNDKAKLEEASRAHERAELDMQKGI